MRLSALLANPAFRIYVAIDKGTFSAAMDDAMGFKSSLVTSPGLPAGLAARIFVLGEPTGGKPSGYGNVIGFTLPASRLPGQYSTKFIPAPDGIPDDSSFFPDIPVGLRSRDYFARYDPVLAAIFARTGTAAPAATGTAITVNAASYRADQGVAPGSLAAAFGAFSTVPDQVLVAGTAAGIVSAALSQVNFIVPASSPAGPAAISIRAGGQEVASGQVTITPTGPGIFVTNPTDPSQPGAIIYTPAVTGRVIQIFATGYGDAPVEVMIGDTAAQVLYSAPSEQFPGLWQINAQLPDNAAGQVPVYLLAGGLASNAVTIRIE